uniref:Uncharacterized protein n=1 Tax=Onchocerca volvulus TaxID=6282 RepID=A0A8R1TIN0_ONCVO
MAHLSGLVRLSLLLATFLPTFLSQFNENHIDSQFDGTNIDMGLCRRECLELNQNAIIRIHEKDNSILAGLCYNATKLRSDYFSSYHLHLTDEAKSIIISYICDRETGKWKYDGKHSISLYETSNYTCPEVQQVLNLRSCPITDMFLKSIDMHFNGKYK